MTGNICVYAHLFLRQLEFSTYSFADIVLEAQIPISITVHRATQVTNQQVCVPYERGTIRTNKQEGA